METIIIILLVLVISALCLLISLYSEDEKGYKKVIKDLDYELNRVNKKLHACEDNLLDRLQHDE